MPSSDDVERWTRKIDRIRVGVEEGLRVNQLCRRRVLHLERGILRFLDANDAGEMSNRDAAIAHLRRLMEEV